MANMGALLKSEIGRIARRESNSIVGQLRDKVLSLKKVVSSHAKLLEEIEKELLSLRKNFGGESVLMEANEDSASNSRLSAGSIARLRKKLGLSRSAFAIVLGTNQNSVYMWENGRTSPRSSMKAKIVQLRGLGKREVKKMLDGKSAPDGKPALRSLGRPKGAVNKAKSANASEKSAVSDDKKV